MKKRTPKIVDSIGPVNPKHTEPIGVLKEKARGVGMNFVIQADIQGVKFDPRDKLAIQNTRAVTRHLLIHGLQTIGRAVQAMLIGIAKGDTDGAMMVQGYVLKAFALLDVSTDRAIKNGLEHGKLFPEKKDEPILSVAQPSQVPDLDATGKPHSTLRILTP